MVRTITLGEAVAEYLHHIEVRGLSPFTIRSRRSSLEQLVRHVGDIKLHNVEPRHIDSVFHAHNWSQGTRNTRVSLYRTFFAWCRGCGYLRGTDPTFGWRRKAPAEVSRLRIPRTEWGTLLDACVSPYERIVVGSGLYLFLRASEQSAIRLEHVHLDENEVDIFRSKTGTRDRMPITSELAPMLREWLAYYSASVSVQPHHFLFPALTTPTKRDERGRLITGTGKLNPTKPMRRPHVIVQRVLGRCGYPTYWEGEHTLRRSGARAYFDSLVSQGYDGALRRVQSMLGHKNSVMTEVYLGLDLDRQTRNADLAGLPMFPVVDTSNVTRLEAYRGEA